MQVKNKRPLDISKITEQLYISERPSKDDIPILKDLGIKLIISMTWQWPDSELRQPPFTLVRATAVDSPLTPIPMKVFIKGTDAAIPVIKNGDKVLVHCIQGVHRSVAMAACILIRLGYSAREATELIKSQRSLADPDVEYINKRIKKFEALYLSGELGNT